MPSFTECVVEKVIKIIREEDNPKAILIKTFELSDLQAESILNIRLRALRKLDEERLIKEQQENTLHVYHILISEE